MARVQLVPASRAHVGRIARRMRRADVEECRAKGREPVSAVRYSLAASSFALTALLDGSPHAMLGVTPYSLVESVGRPWMLATEDVYREGRALLDLGPRLVAVMHDSFRRLENVVSASNSRSIRMLVRWGFTVEAKGQEVGGVTFLPFWRDRHV